VYQLLDSDEFKFDIPVYQRPYSWRTKQVYELTEDFLKAYHAKQEYFLGAIVTTRSAHGTAVPYQVIDGQQRLTSLFIMLAFLHGWAKEQGHDVLQGRVWRMLHCEADPLDFSSTSRFRLKLREADDAFFRENVLESFLPQKHYFSGVAAQQLLLQQQEQQEQGALHMSLTEHAGLEEANLTSSLPDATPLDNESHWRLYENAAFLRARLNRLMGEGLNLQDFMFHILRNCFVVVMTARDEAASFRIFSTLNSRGMDLSVVDKLKADLLQVLEPAERTRYADAWAEMENLLGRSAFHGVFDHMKELATVLEPEVSNLTVLEYFTRKLHEPHTVSQVIQVALDYARILLQLRQNRWDPPAGPSLSGGGLCGASEEQPARGTPSTASTDLLHPSAVYADLAQQSRFMNLFNDEGWLPVTLEFFMQVEEPELRLRFLRAVEALQLYLELVGDAALRAARWKALTLSLLRRPLDPRAVVNTAELTPTEKAAFVARLDSKDLAATAEQRTLVHLLLRAEGSAATHAVPAALARPPVTATARSSGEGSMADESTSNSGTGGDADVPELNFSQLRAERIVPQYAPEGSQWRRTKLTLEVGSSTSSSSGATAAATGTEVKYWYEVQRVYWQAKLGNLILLPRTEARSSGIAEADYSVKAAFFKQCGAERLFPRFSGPVTAAGGRYARQHFSFEECRQRHTELLEALCQVYHLG